MDNRDLGIELMKLNDVVKNIQDIASNELGKSTIPEKDKLFVESELEKIKESLSNEMAKFHKAFTK